MVGLVAALCFESIPSCNYLTLLTRPGWCLGNYPPPANMNFILICRFPYILLSGRFSTAIVTSYYLKDFFAVAFCSLTSSSGIVVPVPSSYVFAMLYINFAFCTRYASSVSCVFPHKKSPPCFLYAFSSFYTYSRKS